MDYSIYRVYDVRDKVERLKLGVLDIMIIGATGSGKSTTLNTLLQRESAVVGRGVDPETMDIKSYRFNKWIRFWDTPGLGDGIYQDKIHSKKIKKLLNITYAKKKYGCIDMVVVIIEGSKKEMGTTFKILNELLKPNISANRIIIAVNQADEAMGGYHWYEKNVIPDEKLKIFLDEQATSIKNRIKDSTGISIKKPVYYSALNNYNIYALLDFIIDNIPKSRRYMYRK